MAFYLFVFSSKYINFAFVIELDRHIEILLLNNDCVIIPDFGGFMTHHVAAVYDGENKRFLPPSRTLGFNHHLQLNDSLLAQSYVEVYDISYPEAVARIAEEVEELKQHLKNEGQYELNGLGTLYNTNEGYYTFEPSPAGVLTPSLYGLNVLDVSSYAGDISSYIEKEDKAVAYPFEMSASPVTEGVNNTEPPPVSSSSMDVEETNEQGESEIDWDEDTFTSRIPTYAKRVAIAACAALLIFLLFPSIIRNGTISNVTKSMVDTELFTRVMPKEITGGSESISKINITNTKDIQGSALNTAESKGILSETPAESSADFYCLVLASKVTKKNAALFAQQLQEAGYSDTDVLIRNKSVKVIYGHFATLKEACDTLRKLQENDNFADSWVMHVK